MICLLDGFSRLLPDIADNISLQSAVNLVFLSGYEERAYKIIQTILAHINNVDKVHELMRKHYLNSAALDSDMKNYFIYIKNTHPPTND